MIVKLRLLVLGEHVRMSQHLLQWQLQSSGDFSAINILRLQSYYLVPQKGSLKYQKIISCNGLLTEYLLLVTQIFVGFYLKHK